MPAKRPTLSIPKPCHEAWEHMTPQEQGRHCASCDKLVIDFSRMSDQQLIDFLHQKGNTCGRFRPDQLERPLVSEAVKGQRRFAPAWLLSTIFSAISLASLQAQHVSRAEPISQEQRDDTGELIHTKAKPLQSFSSISGKVSDTETHQPIPFANVWIQGTEIGTTADSGGAFQLDLPPDSTFSEVLLRVKSVGYRTADLIVTADNHLDAALTLDLHLAITGLYVITEPLVPVVTPATIVDKTVSQRVKDVLLWPYRRIRYAIQGL